MSLKERREVVSLYRAAAAAGGVLFSVVRVAGSSYRQPGARMLALPNGETAGTISGGCLEGDLLRRAEWTVRSGAVMERFVTTFDDTADIPYGLGCGGEIDLLVEPLDTPEAAALLAAMDATLRREERIVATLLPKDEADPTVLRRPLGRIVLDQRGDVVFASECMPTEDVVELRFLMRRALAVDSRYQCVESSQGSFFVEPLLPVQRLLIFGAGEDARPLARMALEMGWLPVVVDTRANRATAARFPGAERVVTTTSASVPVAAGDAAILMTHSYAQDRALLAELLQAPLSYLGLLGARHRSALLLQEASSLAGVSLAEAVRAIHAPIGLELGGEGPEAIALAIVAEVQKTLGARAAECTVSSRRMDLLDVEAALASGPAAAVYEACVLSVADNSLAGSL